MPNLSQIKRERMMAFLQKIKDEHRDDDEMLIALGEIESELNAKKYGLVWEQHEEAVDVMMQDNIPVFTEIPELEIVSTPENRYSFILEGDNLHSLHLLTKTHSERIDFIYIDPPYNTKNKDFIYDDKRIDSTDGFQHSKWLSFMSERLTIAGKLLSKKGIMAISIGYQEVNNLMLLCQELFSTRNVVCVTVQTSSGNAVQNGFTYVQEYIVFITPNDFEPFELESEKKEYSTPYHGMNLSGFNQVQRANQAYPIFVDANGKIIGCGKTLQERIDEGLYTGEKADFIFDYDEAPEGAVAIWPVTQRGDSCVWRLIPTKLMQNWKLGYIKVVPNKKGKNKYTIQYLSGGIIDQIEAGVLETYQPDANIPTLEVVGFKTSASSIPTIWSNNKFLTSAGSKDIKDIFGVKVDFPFPKPVELIKEILMRTSGENDIVLDFFAGSGTTAQAVLELNEEDGGNRTFIICTNNENGICDKITYPRVKTVVLGERSDGSTYSYENQDRELLWEHKITMADFKKSSIHEEISSVKRENEGAFHKFATEIKDGSVFLYGVKAPSKVSGLAANVKYYRTDFISKDEEYLSDALLGHIEEMIQLEHGVKIDGSQHLIIMSDEEADELQAHWSEYPNVKALYVSKNVLFTTEQNRLFAAVAIHVIPDYYFNFELKEVGETW